MRGHTRAGVKQLYPQRNKNVHRIQPGNYRPVSLASVISKIMESLIRDEIVEHMVKQKLLSDFQHGFVPGRDCMTQLLLCLEEWTEMMGIGMPFDVIYTDFAKAFDSVAHERLLTKLNSIGIKGDLSKWVKSFLCGRTQCVNVEGTTSEWKEVLSGIPQGSVLGPILFVVFINDMPEEVKYSTCLQTIASYTVSSTAMTKTSLYSGSSPSILQSVKLCTSDSKTQSINII